MDTYRAIGLMSGSSLDGLDIAYCAFTRNQVNWQYEILQTAYYPMPEKWQLRLQQLRRQDALTFFKTHTYFGHFIGEQINRFIGEYGLGKQIDVIGSHGHTIFHEPGRMLTCQIGDASAIAALTGIPTAANFRNLDLALGGEGAPLAPIGDLHLFHEYPLCLNLGGIANISYKKDHQHITGCDVCPANQPLNYLSAEMGLAYDEQGANARKGSLIPELLERLNALDFYRMKAPKSLSNEWVEEIFIPELDRFGGATEDKLHTVCEHIAFQTGQHIDRLLDGKPAKSIGRPILVSGGGAFNTFLIEKIREYTAMGAEPAGERIIRFKEAIIMAFMAVLRIRGEFNCLRAVTGARRDSVGGDVYLHQSIPASQ